MPVGPPLSDVLNNKVGLLNMNSNMDGVIGHLYIVILSPIPVSLNRQIDFVLQVAH